MLSTRLCLTRAKQRGAAKSRWLRASCGNISSARLRHKSPEVRTEGLPTISSNVPSTRTYFEWASALRSRHIYATKLRTRCRQCSGVIRSLASPSVANGKLRVRYILATSFVRTDFVAQAPDGHSKQSCRIGSISLIAFQRLKNHFAFDARKRVADQALYVCSIDFG